MLAPACAVLRLGCRSQPYRGSLTYSSSFRRIKFRNLVKQNKKLTEWALITKLSRFLGFDIQRDPRGFILSQIPKLRRSSTRPTSGPRAHVFRLFESVHFGSDCQGYFTQLGEARGCCIND